MSFVDTSFGKYAYVDERYVSWGFFKLFVAISVGNRPICGENVCGDFAERKGGVPGHHI